MGFYYDDKIYGVRIFGKNEQDPEPQEDEDQELKLIFEKLYDNPMTEEEKEDIKVIFNSFKSPKRIVVYVECTCTLDYPPSTDKMWTNAYCIANFLDTSGLEEYY